MVSSRKPRPLNRDQQVYRDDRLYLVACDDTYAPDQYFKAYEQAFNGTRVQVRVIPTEDGTSSAEHVLNRLLAVEGLEDYDQRWLVLDTDHYINDSHRASFLKALSRARQEGVRLAISHPSFEFWLILHHVPADDSRLSKITDADLIGDLLREVLGSYNKKNLDHRHFTLSNVSQAIRRAALIDGETPGGDIPERPTTRVYLLWKEIIRNASLAQLPYELQEIKLEISSEQAPNGGIAPS